MSSPPPSPLQAGLPIHPPPSPPSSSSNRTASTSTTHSGNLPHQMTPTTPLLVNTTRAESVDADGRIRLDVIHEGFSSTSGVDYSPLDMSPYIYYQGLVSYPLLIATTHLDLVPETPGHPVGKSLFGISVEDPILSIWESVLGPQVMALIDASCDTGNVTIDLVKIGIQEHTARRILWIGVESMSRATGDILCANLQTLLVDHGMSDWAVEIKQSSLKHSTALYDVLDSSLSALVKNLAQPCFIATGLTITASSAPTKYGTGGIFVRDRQSGKHLLLTNQHVVAQDEESTVTPDLPGERAVISFLSDAALQSVLDAIQEEKDSLRTLASEARNGTESLLLKGRDDAASERALEAAAYTQQLTVAETVYERIHQRWSNPDDRLLGAVFCHPPREYPGKLAHESDWALVEVDTTMHAASSLVSRCIVRPHNRVEANSRPELHPHLPRSALDNGYLPIAGYRDDAELRVQQLAVLKTGAASGLTIGQGLPYKSFVRSRGRWALEWPVIGSRERPFSKPGDSGSAVVDREGRMCGILTSGGIQDINDEGYLDVTYCEPYWHVLEGMKRFGLDPVII